MNLNEIGQITKSVVHEANIESSSDFIMVAYELNNLFYPKLAQRIEPVLDVEYNNYHDEWAANACYSQSMLVGLDSKDYYDAMHAYRCVLDFFLNDDNVAKIFNLDIEDYLGWKIYRELDTKYSYCNKMHKRALYNEQLQGTL